MNIKKGTGIFLIGAGFILAIWILISLLIDFDLEAYNIGGLPPIIVILEIFGLTIVLVFIGWRLFSEK